MTGVVFPQARGAHIVKPIKGGITATTAIPKLTASAVKTPTSLNRPVSLRTASPLHKPGSTKKSITATSATKSPARVSRLLAPTASSQNKSALFTVGVKTGNPVLCTKRVNSLAVVT